MKKLAVSIVVLAVAAFVWAAGTKTVSLMWTASVSPLATGYKVYVWTNQPAIGPVWTVYDVGPAVTVTVTNLDIGALYYAYATAYDSNKLESVPSNTIQFGYPFPPGGVRIP